MPELIIDIAATVYRKECLNARAGWSMVMRLGSGHAQICRPLCRKCNQGSQTHLRAHILALVHAAKAAHEVLKLGDRAEREDALCDTRPLYGNYLSVVVRTDNCFVAAFGSQQKHTAHRDLEILYAKIQYCLCNADVDFQIKHIRGKGDWHHRQAVELAKAAAEGEISEHCRTCGDNVGPRIADLVDHLKREHLKRDLEIEEKWAGDCVREVGLFRCDLCGASAETDELLQSHLSIQHNFSDI